MQLQDAIKKRRSVRKFSDKVPNWRHVVRAIDSARFAPMAGGYYSARFILVSDEEKIKSIADQCQQNFVGDSKFILVVTSETKKVTKLYDEGEKYAHQQVGAAIENVVLSLTEAGIASCWVETFLEEPIKRLLSIPDDVEIVALIPLGIEAKIKVPHVSKKPELEGILFYNAFGSKNMIPETIVTHQGS